MTDFGPIGRAPVIDQVLYREANRYCLRNQISRNYDWIDVDSADIPSHPADESLEAGREGTAPAEPPTCVTGFAVTPKDVRPTEPTTHAW